MPRLPVLFALVIPLVFLHAEYQPSLSAGEATLYVSDVAVLAAGAIGLAAGISRGFAPLAAARAVWVSSAVFIAVVLWSTVFGAIVLDEYASLTHFLTAAKFAEYALLAVAAPLVVRAPRDLVPMLTTLTLWSSAATGFAVLQFFGLVAEFEGKRPGQREPSFLGTHDLAALSGATLAIALLAIALGTGFTLSPSRDRAFAWVAGLSGGLGLVLSGAVTGLAGVLAAAVAAWLLGRRRALALAAVVVVVAGGVFAIRAVDTTPLLDALGIEREREVVIEPQTSWHQRVALAYIGGRIFLDHPLLGVGWQGSEAPESYEPYVGDARRRFPDLPRIAFPSPQHPWGVQNAYVQAAADMGVVGLGAFLALFLVPLAVVWRSGAAGGVPILWLLVAMSVWLGLGIVAGIPLVGLTWLAIGLAAASESWSRERPR